MDAVTLSTVAVGVVAVLTVVIAIIRWFFKRGADEREMTLALKANTEAVRQLGAKHDHLGESMDAMRDSFMEFRHDVYRRFDEFDFRLKSVEAPVHVHVSSSPDRNASSQG